MRDDYVEDGDDKAIEAACQRVTDALNAVQAEAEKMVGK